MVWSPTEISALFSSKRSAEHEQDERSWRASQLRGVVAAIRDEGPDGLAAAVEKLADGARDPAWRLPIGDSGLLEFVLSAAPVTERQHPANKQALRLIGNACADCDENRTRVVESGVLSGFVVDCMKHDPLLPFAIAATMNVCVDCNPAQRQASEAGLSRVLVDIVSGERLSSCLSSLTHMMTILELLCNQDPEPRLANPDTPALLLRLATSERYEADLDAFMEICTPALAYLTFQDFQPVFVEGGGLELLELAAFQLYTRFDTADADEDTANQLKQVGDAFLTVFADLSALPSFSANCPLESEPARTLISWLHLSPDLSHLQIAACLSLGNLSRSDESSTALLKHVQDPILRILSRAIPPVPPRPPLPRTSVPPPQLTHAALGLLKNLAIPVANKPILGAALLDPSRAVLARLLTATQTQPQLQFAAVSLARLLLANCPSNVRRMCAPLPDGQSSSLSLLTSAASAADQDPIKMEAARAASLVCRTLHSRPVADVLDPSWTWASEQHHRRHSPVSTTSSPPDSSCSPAAAAPSHGPTITTAPSSANEGDDGRDNRDEEHADDVLARFLAAHTPALTTSLGRLLTQTRFPSLRSDAIFVLALMSRCCSASHNGGGGARLALRVLMQQQQQQSPRRNSREDGDGDGDGAVLLSPAWRVVAGAILGGLEEGLFTGEEAEEVFSSEGATGTGTGTGKVEVGSEKERGTKADDGVKDRAWAEKDVEEVKQVFVDKLTLEPQQVDAQTRQPEGLAKMDRENAMVLVAELLRRFPDELSELKRPLEAVLCRGGGLVVQDREQAQKGTTG